MVPAWCCSAPRCFVPRTSDKPPEGLLTVPHTASWRRIVLSSNKPGGRNERSVHSSPIIRRRGGRAVQYWSSGRPCRPRSGIRGAHHAFVRHVPSVTRQGTPGGAKCNGSAKVSGQYESLVVICGGLFNVGRVVPHPGAERDKEPGPIGIDMHHVLIMAAPHGEEPLGP